MDVRDRKSYNAAYYARNKERAAERARARRADPEVRARDVARARAHRQANPQPQDTERNTRTSWLRRLRLLGISEEDYQQRLVQQEGRCAICRTDTPWSRSDTWAVDHNHETGAVRGLLCHDCNRALGQFRDNPGVLRRAAEYVEKGGC